MLAAIVEKASGFSFFDFLKVNLFEPLQITKATWEVCSQGITAGGMGLSLTTESIAKFGQMLLDKGVYDGKRIVSEKYIELATSKQSDMAQTESGKHKEGYGYQIRIAKNGCFFGVGSFGQLCFVAPSEKMVIAITSRKKNWDDVIDLIYEKLLAKVTHEPLTVSDEFRQLSLGLQLWHTPFPRLKQSPEVHPI